MTTILMKACQPCEDVDFREIGVSALNDYGTEMAKRGTTKYHREG